MSGVSVDNILSKLNILSRTTEETQAKLNLIDSGVATATNSGDVFIRFNKRFTVKPKVLVYYKKRGEIPEYKPVEVPEIPPVKAPVITVTIPDLEGISITLDLPEIDIPTMSKIAVKRLARLPMLIPALPSMPKLPKINLLTALRIKIPSVRIPRLRRRDFAILWRDAAWNGVNNAMNRILGDWGVFNYIKDMLKAPFKALAATIGFALGFGMNIFWDTMIQPQIDYVQDSINRGLDSLRKNIETTIRKVLDTMQNNMLNFRNNLEGTFRALANNVTGAVSGTLNEYNNQMNKVIGSIEGNMNLIVDSVNNNISVLKNYSTEIKEKMTYTLQENMNAIINRLNERLGGLSNALSKGITEAFSVSTEAYTNMLNSYNKRVNEVIKIITGNMNMLADSFVKAFGFVSGEFYAPTSPKEITNDGFTVVSPAPGTVFYWIAIGL